MTTLPSLPAGTVTFLFTDIEGSTRLWEIDRASMQAAVARHDDLLESAVAAAGGVVFKHVGDAIQAAFSDPAAALAAAVTAQEVIAAESWEGTGPLRVRMALHLGEAAPNAGGDYNQVACLNRLSRMLSTGFGGQLLLSDAVRQQVEGRLPDRCRLRDLGDHRLRDLLEAERIWQADIHGLPDVFPPLKSLEGFPTNLPVQPDPLLGRERELAALASLLPGDGSCRLVTLTGPGGAGKTRLALQAAADALESFPGGAFLVRLGEVHDPSLVLPSIASTLGVREGGGLDLPASLAAYLSDRRFLLVLDNFEQLAVAAADIGRLLEQCRHLRVLVSSRTPLHLPGERLLEVGPLALPDPRSGPDEVAAAPSAALFARRAAAAAGSFAIDESNAADVARILQRLDGLALAIELAAARLRFQTPAELLSDLDRRLDLGAGGTRAGLPHQSTLAATIAWSYERLTPRQQEILQRLSLFTGGWTPEAMREVIPAPGEHADDLEADVLRLAEASLLRRDGSGGDRRWSMLRTINRFAAERFRESEAREETAGRYLRWAMHRAEAENARIAGPDQASALAALEREHDNFISALALLRESGDGRALAALVLALHRFWRVRGHLTEGRRWLRATLEVPDAPLPDRMRACLADGQFALQQGDYGGARSLLDEGLAIARSIGDEGREAAFLVNLGAVALTVGELAEADRQFSSALAIAERLEDTSRRLDALANLGALAHYRGDVKAAAARYAECLRLREELGDIRGAAEMAVNLLLLLAPIPAQRDRARTFGEQALTRMESIGDRSGMGIALTGLGWLLDAAGNPAGAVSRHLEALALFEEVGDLANVARALGNAGLAEVSAGDVESGISRLREALRRWADLGEPSGIAASLDGLSWAVRSEDPEAAARWARAARQIRQRHDLPMQAEFAPRFEEVAETLASHGIVLDEALGAGPDVDERAVVLEALGERPDRPAPRMADLLAGLDDDLGL